MQLVCGELVGWVWREAIVFCRCGIFTTVQARGNIYFCMIWNCWYPTFYYFVTMSSG